MTEYGPTARHRRLAAELRRLREEAGLKPEVAAGALNWSRTKLVRIETASLMPKVADVERITETYGKDSTTQAVLLQLTRDIRNRGWWAAYGDVLAGSYAELEDAASRIRSWQTEVVPGLLQTEDYARTLIAGEYPDSQDEIDRRLQARMTRRARLARGDVEFDVLLAEEVLRRLVGGPVAMAQQLGALLEAGDRPNITIRVVPMVPYRPALGLGSLILFQFDAPLELDTAYVDTMGGGMYIEDVAQVRRCTTMLDRIADAAMPVEESRELIATIHEEVQSLEHD